MNIKSPTARFSGSACGAFLCMLLTSGFAQALPTDTPTDKCQHVIDRATDYLKSQQKPDGGWQNESDIPAMTAIVVKCFAREPAYGPSNPLVKKGYDKLLTYQLENGGIYKDLLASYNTAIAVSALSFSNDPVLLARRDKALAYLKSLQWTDNIAGLPRGETIAGESDPRFGGFGYSKKGRPDGSNVNLVLDALHDANVQCDDKAFQNALKFVTRLQNASTNDQPWAGTDGGFIYSTAFGGESQAGEYVDSSGKKMFRSYGSMTYAGLKSRIYAGLTKNDPRVKAGMEWVAKNWTLDENPGMRLGNPEAGQAGLFYYYLTLARCLHAYKQPVITDAAGVKHDWRIELTNKIASLQKDDGHFEGDKKWMENVPVLSTGYAVQALQEAREDLGEYPPK
jgi:squalene-hopene/tetraprenyl-beta-curcumene cyclase